MSEVDPSARREDAAGRLSDAEITDVPQAEQWQLREDLAEEIIKRAEELGKEAGEIVQDAIRSQFGLSDIAGETPISLIMDESSSHLAVLDRDDDLTRVVVVASRVRGNITPLGLFHQCLENYLFPMSPDSVTEAEYVKKCPLKANNK